MEFIQINLHHSKAASVLLSNEHAMGKIKTALV
jgi:hypothetical protein